MGQTGAPFFLDGRTVARRVELAKGLNIRHNVPLQVQTRRLFLATPLQKHILDRTLRHERDKMGSCSVQMRAWLTEEPAFQTPAHHYYFLVDSKFVITGYQRR